MRRLLMVMLLSAIAGCGSKGEDEPAKAADQTEPAPSAGTPTPVPPADDSADKPMAPPAEKTGTVTYAGTTSELGGDDFGICETVNPAFKGNFNIVTKLDDGTKLKLMGNVDDHSADHQGLILGDMPNEEKATDLEVELDGRTLRGSAQTKAGPIEFRFEC